VATRYPHERSYHERRAVPWWWWAVALAFAVPSTEAVVVLGPEMTTHASAVVAWVTLAVTVALVAWCLLAMSTSDVDVDATGLRAGSILLPASAIVRVRALDAESARRILGRDARADAQLSLRPWVKTAVQIEVDDPLDSTPYWVVATRRPHELVHALNELRRTHTDAAGAVDELRAER
jgi:hypothetical protein